MNPNETLRQLRRLAKDIEQQEGKWIDEAAQNHAEAAIGEELATLFEALDDHLSNGGFLPDAWMVADSPELDANGERQSYTPPF